jgi:hypothetical protein
MGNRAAEHIQLAILTERALEARVMDAKGTIAVDLAALEQTTADIRAMLDGHPEAVSHLAGRLRATTLAIDRAAIELRANLEALASLRGAVVPCAAVGAIAQA